MEIARYEAFAGPGRQTAVSSSLSSGVAVPIGLSAVSLLDICNVSF
jgi:hypothetical protein